MQITTEKNRLKELFLFVQHPCPQALFLQRYPRLQNPPSQHAHPLVAKPRNPEPIPMSIQFGAHLQLLVTFHTLNQHHPTLPHPPSPTTVKSLLYLHHVSPCPPIMEPGNSIKNSLTHTHIQLIPKTPWLHYCRIVSILCVKRYVKRNPFTT